MLLVEWCLKTGFLGHFLCLLGGSGAIYARKNHTKIIREYSAIIGGVETCYAYQKISDARTIKKSLVDN